MNDDIIKLSLVKTNRRLTLDILFQRDDTRYRGPDDGDYYRFVASNGYEVISRSRMDIQTERLWLLGASENERSGTMLFSSNEKRDLAYVEFLRAIEEWCACVRAGGFCQRGLLAGGYHMAQFIGNDSDQDVDECPKVYRAVDLAEGLTLERVYASLRDGSLVTENLPPRQPSDFVRIGAALDEVAVREWLDSYHGYPKGNRFDADIRQLHYLVRNYAPGAIDLVRAELARRSPELHKKFKHPKDMSEELAA